jgi:hypothetical protein
MSMQVNASRSSAISAERDHSGYNRATGGHGGLPLRRVLRIVGNKLVEADPSDGASELRTYMCAECGHTRTYSVAAGNS